MNTPRTSATLHSRLGTLALSAATLLACGQTASDAINQEGYPEPIATTPADGARSAQAVDPTKLAKIRADLLVAVNKARAVARTCGTTAYPAAPALKADTRLHTASQVHADDMVAKDYFSHTGSDGSQPWDRMTKAGYKWSAAGENIAAGNSTVDATMTQWLTSAGHCANIMSKNYTQIGFGYAEGATYHYYWVQDFGKPL